MDISSTTTLHNGVDMPLLGLGVYKIREGKEAVDAVRWAIEAGYRLIDTASAYGNEKSVGEAIRQSGIDRKDIFITTKMWTDDMRQGRQRETIMESLEKLNTDYIDLYLLHWPTPDYYVQSWEILIDVYKQGLIRAIGVSNFHDYHLDAIIQATGVVPTVDQFEIHPYLSQVPLCATCEKLGIVPEAWSPLGRGAALKDQTIASIAQKYGKTPAQVVIRWEIQRGIITIPKSVHRERIRENADVFDFELSGADMDRINAINRDERRGSNPDTFAF